MIIYIKTHKHDILVSYFAVATIKFNTNCRIKYEMTKMSNDTKKKISQSITLRIFKN